MCVCPSIYVSIYVCVRAYLVSADANMVPASSCLVQEMIENYVQWNEDIGEWQLVSSAYSHSEIFNLRIVRLRGGSFFINIDSTEQRWCDCFMLMTLFPWLLVGPQKCVAYTGNNMRKQTPVPDKKDKDVSS